jgi:hypothetical protein
MAAGFARYGLPVPVFLQIPPRNPIGPKPSQPQSGELFRPKLDEQLNTKHPLVRLTALIDWTEIERTFAVSFTSGRGRPALAPRLIAGLLVSIATTLREGLVVGHALHAGQPV